ncbi:MAG: hypothetical protein ACOC04_01450 [Halothece sp.]
MANKSHSPIERRSHETPSEMSRNEDLQENLKEKENFDIRSPNKIGEVQEKLPENELTTDSVDQDKTEISPETMADKDISTEIGINYGLKSPPQ